MVGRKFWEVKNERLLPETLGMILLKACKNSNGNDRFSPEATIPGTTIFSHDVSCIMSVSSGLKDS
ncbi:MAG: hypothetical protein U9N37_02715 [Thermodesulfobacteriota bacterium]|nr:hypothetical protein [Thermodesulfobacteriota bacterium]